MNFLGKTISGCFTIPSGVITTQTAAIARIAAAIPEVGVITTKSIGLNPCEGYREPILTQYAPGCFMNAVGLANPGADAFARQLENLNLPQDRFLLISIFGKDAAEFVRVAEILAPFADGLELNLSCPHAAGYGMAIGQDPQLVRKITAAVKTVVTVPVIPKLTPNVPNIGQIASAAVDGGANALCAINTVGPGYYTVDGDPVLTHITGGMSGRGILPIGLNCVKQITDAVRVPVIACGGIRSAADVRAYRDAGASVFGIGSALAGLSTPELKEFFAVLGRDGAAGSNQAALLLKTDAHMDFTQYELAANRALADDLHILTFNRNIDIQPGQFIFARIPGIGEKPFSVLDRAPLTLAIRKVGCFTEQLIALTPEKTIYIRGPYGKAVAPRPDAAVVLLSGGCGLAALYQIAKDHQGPVMAFIGAKDQDHLFYLDELKQHAAVYLATDDGSAGFPGFVTDLLAEQLPQIQSNMKANTPFMFYNCGPEPMIEKAVEIEQSYTSPENIFLSVDYITRCGVGVCGSCAAPDGRRLCVDGPFLEMTP